MITQLIECIRCAFIRMSARSLPRCDDYTDNIDRCDDAAPINQYMAKFQVGAQVDATFWIGLVLGGVIGIVLELLTRPLQRFLDRRLETRSQLRGDDLRRQKVGNREAVRDFLVLQVLETTLIGALTGIGSGVLFGVSDLVNWNIQDQWWQKGLVVAGQIVAVVGGLLVLRIAGDAISIARAASERKPKKERSAE
jgi:lipid-A-disaccharide synthase-like uncharacterized protein